MYKKYLFQSLVLIACLQSRSTEAWGFKNDLKKVGDDIGSAAKDAGHAIGQATEATLQIHVVNNTLEPINVQRSKTIWGMVRVTQQDPFNPKQTAIYDLKLNVAFPSSGASGQVNQTGFVVYFPGDFILRPDLMRKAKK